MATLLARPPQLSRPAWAAASVRIARRLWPGLLWLALAGGAAWWLGGVDAGAGAPSPYQELVRWQDAERDWLIVVDPRSHELVVYDAVDGRPLRRLGRGQGLGEVVGLAGQGSVLLVLTRQPSRLHYLRLPQLAPAMRQPAPL